MNESKKEMINNIDIPSISHWISTGFFFDEKYFTIKNSQSNNVRNPVIDWHYNPSERTYEETLRQFSTNFDKILSKFCKDYKIVLPISGGLDSRTLACALMGKKNVISYSYEFEDGVRETKYAKRIAELCGFEFHSLKIPRGYLWNEIDKISTITKCRTEFTHPRQMAVIEQISSFGDILISGSLGDLLFDSFDIPSANDQKSILDIIISLITKPGGLELAEEIWEYWELEGSFTNSLRLILKNKLESYSVKNSASLIRAFKIDNYVKNWTNVNLDVFSNYIKTYAPYHDKLMCEFVCTVPERYLKRRQIQIDYIKSTCSKLASVPWQKYDLSLYKYKYFNSIYFPRRVLRYASRMIKEKLLFGAPVVERNWEIQFLGTDNRKALEHWLFDNSSLQQIIPKEIVNKYYNNFIKVDMVKYSHPLSMLLTLSVWAEKFWKKK